MAQVHKLKLNFPIKDKASRSAQSFRFPFRHRALAPTNTRRDGKNQGLFTQTQAKSLSPSIIHPEGSSRATGTWFHTAQRQKSQENMRPTQAAHRPHSGAARPPTTGHHSETPLTLAGLCRKSVLRTQQNKVSPVYKSLEWHHLNQEIKT